MIVVAFFFVNCRGEPYPLPSIRKLTKAHKLVFAAGIDSSVALGPKSVTH